MRKTDGPTRLLRKGVSLVTITGLVTFGALTDILVGAQSASASDSWAQASRVTAPSGAAAGNPNADLSGISCASAGNCVAVGSYVDSSANHHAMVATETSGVWAQAVEVTAPSNANVPYPYAVLDGISCSSAGNCTAVGQYGDNTGTDQAMVVTETSGVWAQAVEVTAPSNANTYPNADLYGVSCSSAGDCTAVGQYTDGSYNSQAMAATETSGSWAQAVEVTAPSDAITPYGYAALKAVSCSSAGDCTAVGQYYGGLGSDLAMVATESGDVWGQAAVVAFSQLPSNAANPPYANLDGISCSSAGDCTAVGQYGDNTSTDQAMAATESGGSWARAVEVTAPSGAGSYPYAGLSGISCSAAGDCGGAGQYVDSSGGHQAMVAVETSGVWAQAVEVTAPSGAGSNPYAHLDGISCPSAGGCTATGQYYASPGGYQAMAATDILAAPIITTQPTNQVVLVGYPATFDAVAAGNPNPTWQWEISTDSGATWTAIAGATSASYTTPPTTATESGSEYRAVATNTQGIAVSNPATLTVKSCPCPSFLVTDRWTSPGRIQKLTWDGTDPSTSVIDYTYLTNLGSNNGPDSALFEPNGDLIASETDTGKLVVTDPATNTVVNSQLNTGSLSNPADMALDPTSGSVWVINWNGTTSLAIAKVSLSDGTTTYENPNVLQHLGGIVFNGDGTRLFVTSHDGYVDEINPTNGYEIRALYVGGQPDGMTYDPYTGHLFTSGCGGLCEIDIGTDTNPALSLVAVRTAVDGDGIEADGAGHIFVVASLTTLDEYDVTTHTATVVTTSLSNADDVVPLTGAGAAPPAASVSISTFSPTQGTPGTSVTISGSGFTGATGVAFNGTPATTFTVVSDTQITATVPTDATTGPVSVTTSGGSGTSATNFTVEFVSLSPSGGAVDSSVTITGSGFTGATGVSFGGTPATTFSVVSDTEITATVPQGATSGPVVVTLAGGLNLTVAADFEVVPGVTSLTPSDGPVGTTVTLTGTSFTGATGVSFNGTSATFTVVSDTQITATVPAGATTGPVSVTTPSGSGASATDFTVDPTVDPVGGLPGSPVAVGTLLCASTTYTAAHGTTASTAAWNWGDGTTDTQTLSGTTGTTTDCHTYTTAGVYNVTVSVTDADGGVGSSTFALVVYDPSAGFVTGGGWLDSPAGAYTADPTLTGRANFGFVSQYKKGATVPTGQTEFQFQAGDLDFHSSTYQWLVVSGTCQAQFKGSGTINGAGSYTFLLTAVDGELCANPGPDRFRIQITDDNNGGATVYDNGTGGIGNEAISGGDIQIHS